MYPIGDQATAAGPVPTGGRVDRHRRHGSDGPGTMEPMSLTLLRWNAANTGEAGTQATDG
jgi:hypothetical protein